MSGIARLMLSHGEKVSGSDLKRTPITQELEKLGAAVFIGHDGRNVKGAGLIVYSSAIKEDNPEMIEAKRLNIPVIKRAQALAELMKDKSVITVTGSHGKTTTASLVSCLLMEAGMCPTVAIGGILRNIENNACLGKGDYFVAEADESDGSFLYYKPKYSIITNIDYEHLDHYKDFKAEVEAFGEFINKTEQGGCLFCCSDDENLRSLLERYRGKYLSFGFNKADVYPENITMEGLTSEFDCKYRGKLVGRFRLALGGRHNISNALSVIALGLELGIGLDAIKRSLSNYKGSGRRTEIKFRDKEYLVIDDYAHHPTEIKATLEAVRNLKAGRIIAVFQPHRYTRTQLLWDRFGPSLDLADHCIITDIYPASEPPIEGIDAPRLAEMVRKSSGAKKVEYLKKDDIAGHIMKIVRPGDLVVTLGAGDIVKVSDELVERFSGKR